jgi:hypothetical protein
VAALKAEARLNDYWQILDTLPVSYGTGYAKPE